MQLSANSEIAAYKRVCKNYAFCKIKKFWL